MNTYSLVGLSDRMAKYTDTRGRAKTPAQIVRDFLNGMIDDCEAEARTADTAHAKAYRRAAREMRSSIAGANPEAVCKPHMAAVSNAAWQLGAVMMDRRLYGMEQDVGAFALAVRSKHACRRQCNKLYSAVGTAVEFIKAKTIKSLQEAH